MEERHALYRYRVLLAGLLITCACQLARASLCVPAFAHKSGLLLQSWLQCTRLRLRSPRRVALCVQPTGTPVIIGQCRPIALPC